MRYLLPLTLISSLMLLVTACSTAPSRTTTRSAAQSAPAKPRWQAVPAKADGVRVAGGRMHIVKHGETGIAIARAYGVSWSRITTANRIGRESILRVGQALFIPIPTTTARPATPSKPSSRSPATPGRDMTPEELAAAFELDIDDLITGSAPAGERVQSRPPARSAAQGAQAARPPATAAVPRMSWPTDGRVILSRFGAKPNGRFNDGINIKALRGQAVRAAADGEVIYVGDAIAGFGLIMLVRHTGGIVTAYGHLEEALADRGNKVTRGQTIARAGSSGSVNEPQLLFQIRQGRKAIDPLPYLQA
ncbi:MAG: M23 family metallopeptidase [Sphingomonadaceae bacterium]